MLFGQLGALYRRKGPGGVITGALFWAGRKSGRAILLYTAPLSALRPITFLITHIISERRFAAALDVWVTHGLNPAF